MRFTDPAADLPPTQRRVLVLTHHLSSKRPIISIAFFVPKFTVEATEFDELDHDYCEERDALFWPEGWYQEEDCNDICWQIASTVTGWANLPRLTDRQLHRSKIIRDKAAAEREVAIQNKWQFEAQRARTPTQLTIKIQDFNAKWGR